MAIGTNLNLTPTERKAAEKAERQDAVIQGAIAGAKELGPGSQGRPVHKDAQKVRTFAQEQDVAAFLASNRPSLHPQAVINDFGEVVEWRHNSKAEYEALRLGFYCRNCHELQREPVMPESALFVPGREALVCETMSGRGCGYPRVGTPINQTWRNTYIGDK